MTKDEAIKLLNIYGEAWEKQDPELILTIFTPDAIYNDPKESPSFITVPFGNTGSAR